MTRRARAARGYFDYWPGFIDVLSTLLLVITFLLSIFMLSQYYLGRALNTRDAELASLQSELNKLAEQLGLAETSNTSLEQALAQLQATLTEEEARRGTAEGQLGIAIAGLAERDDTIADAQDYLILLNQQVAALRQQLAALAAALDASEAKNAEQTAEIENLGARLNVALAQQVQELERYRSEFFGRLREILGERSDIKIVGDRFVFQSEVLFETAEADITPDGQIELVLLADALKQIASEIPPEIDWILRVDGHSDKRPIATPEYPSNLHLSAARAIAVVRFLVSQGVPAERLAAAGFGDLHPVDPTDSEEAYAQNRRIEFKLTER